VLGLPSLYSHSAVRRSSWPFVKLMVSVCPASRHFSNPMMRLNAPPLLFRSLCLIGTNSFGTSNIICKHAQWSAEAESEEQEGAKLEVKACWKYWVLRRHGELEEYNATMKLQATNEVRTNGMKIRHAELRGDSMEIDVYNFGHK